MKEFFVTIKGKLFLMSSKYVGTKESNEVEVMGVLVVQIFSGSFKNKLIWRVVWLM